MGGGEEEEMRAGGRLRAQLGSLSRRGRRGLRTGAAGGPGVGVDDVLPVCNLHRERASVSLGAVVGVYNDLKRSLEGDLSRLGLADDPTAPGRESLCTELRWLVEDSVGRDAADWRELLSGSTSPDEVAGRSLRSRLSPREIREVWRHRLSERVPIQYVLGTASWYDLELRVGPGVLIPRPETEVLLDLALRAMAGRGGALGRHPWLDLGSGSGALAVGLASHSQEACGQSVRVAAVERSDRARAYAEENVSRCGVGDLVSVLSGSWFEPVLDRVFGGIVSNPPYVTGEEMRGLQAEVGRHEPGDALYGGPGGGLDDLEHIASEAAGHLVPGGFLGLETGGGGQAEQLGELMMASTGGASSPWAEVEVRRDLQGVPRFVIATLKSE